MKAAVMYDKGAMPQYVDFPEPKAINEDEVLVTVKAVSLKHFDKKRATGKHYSTEAPTGEGRVIGSDGVCELEDGTRVYGMGENGMIAEKAVINKKRIVKIPDGVDDATAAALPNAVIGAAMGLRFKANIQAGDVVLINGATGFTGRVAVQIAKHYGAKKIIATGRNDQSLQEVLRLGADEIISLTGNDNAFKQQVKAMHSQNPIDVIIDYLWGHPAEMILDCLKGDGNYSNNIRYVSIGSMAGDAIQLSSAVLRSTGITVTGSGLGSWNREEIGKLFTEILPEMFQLADEGKLRVETVTIKAADITKLWDMDTLDRKRIVVTI